MTQNDDYYGLISFMEIKIFIFVILLAYYVHMVTKQTL